jgi:hypothetical protein
MFANILVGQMTSLRFPKQSFIQLFYGQGSDVVPKYLFFPVNTAFALRSLCRNYHTLVIIICSDSHVFGSPKYGNFVFFMTA